MGQRRRIQSEGRERFSGEVRRRGDSQLVTSGSSPDHTIALTITKIVSSSTRKNMERRTHVEEEMIVFINKFLRILLRLDLYSFFVSGHDCYCVESLSE